MSSKHTTSEQVIAALEAGGFNPKRTAAGFVARCPAHDGKKQSLSIKDADNGKTLLRCFSRGCSYEAVLTALGLWQTRTNGAGRQTTAAKRIIIAVYDYDGFYETLRYEPKDFRQRRKQPDGSYVWNLKGVAARLYRQDELMVAKPSELIIVEGEKDVETLRGFDMLSTTNHGGAKKWKQAHTAALVAAGVKTVVVIPDADEPGREHGDKVAALCKAAGLVVKVVALPEPDKDVSAYLGRAGDTAGLLKLAAAAQEWIAPAISEALPTETSEAAPPISEHVVALGFTDKYRHTMRFCPEVGRWFEWDETRWRPDTMSRAFHYARTLAGEASDTKAARRAGFARGVESFCRADPATTVGASYWDADPWLLGTPTCTIDLRDGRTLTADPDHRITKLTSVGPGKAGECPRWLQFLDESTGGDRELVEFLQRFFGYSLTGSVREHALIFLYGSGNNGKSVFLNVLSGILGDYSTTASMDVLTASRYDRHPTELAALASARLVIASETDEGRVWAEARIKALTGGEPISARFMRRDLFTFQPAFKLALSGNSLPTLHNCGTAMRRRFNVIPFDKKPKVLDVALGDKLRSEWAGILRWAVDGCLKWQQSGLGTAAVIEEETDNYFAESDHFGSWLESECELDAESYEPATALFGAWNRYLVKIKEPEENSTKFGRRLRSLGLRKERSHTIRWYGIRLNSVC